MTPTMAKPIFCATHPRACSTAFERVFMTRKDLACVHEPFGDAFYFGPERMSVRYEEEEQIRKDSGYSNATFKTIFDNIEQAGSEGKRVFIKDIIHYLVPPNGKVPSIAPSLDVKKRGVGTAKAAVNGRLSQPPFPFDTEAEPGNPTVVPKALLEKFHFTFLIRDPHSSIPSYYRCTIPPLDKVTGFYDFYPSEAGYDEVRRVFEYLRESGQVGPKHAGNIDGVTNGATGGSTNGVTNGESSSVEICVVDADDLLDNPQGIIKAYCHSVHMDYHPDMLNWNNEEDQVKARTAFEKWRGFHDDAIESTDLKPRAHRKTAKTEAQWDSEWKEKYGEKAANVIRSTVDQNMEDYLYMKQFALKP